MLTRKFREVLLAAVLVSISTVATAQVSGPIMLETQYGTSEVLAWSWAVTGGAGRADVIIEAIQIVRYTDLQSPLFILALATGRVLDEVILRREGLTVTLKNPSFQNYSLSGTESDVPSSGGKKETLPVGGQSESLGLVFEIIEYDVYGAKFCWDVAASASC